VSLRRAAQLGVVALALAGCGGPSQPDAAPSPAAPASKEAGTPAARDGDATALGALLERRAQALEAGNAADYAATATGPQRLLDREAARNAQRVALRDVEIVADSVDVRGRRASLRVRSIYGVRGIRGRFTAARRLTAVRTGKGWRIRSQASRRERHPWEVGPVSERRSRHFVVIAPRGLEIAALNEALETGYARMGDVLEHPRLRERYLVVVAGEAGAARALTARISGVGSLAAISDSQVREAGPAERVTEVPSQRLVVVWPPFSALDADGRMRLVTHELTHAGLAGVTSGRTPAWLLEGMALYVSEDRRAGEAAELLADATSAGARRALSLSGLSRPDAMARLHGDGQQAAYTYASAAAFYIVGRFGRKRYLELYDAFNDEDLTGKVGVEVTGRAVQRTLGLSLTRLERDLRAWIRTQSF
jgi:hypothetical protein